MHNFYLHFECIFCIKNYLSRYDIFHCWWTFFSANCSNNAWLSLMQCTVTLWLWHSLYSRKTRFCGRKYYLEFYWNKDTDHNRSMLFLSNNPTWQHIYLINLIHMPKYWCLKANYLKVFFTLSSQCDNRTFNENALQMQMLCGFI